MTEGHGDDLYRYGGRVIHNFSSNIFARTDHSALMAHLAACGAQIAAYPEPEPYTLESEIASAAGIGSGEVMVTNGATEAVYLVAMMMAGKQAAILAPTFREYQDACRLHHVDITFFGDMESMPEADVIWICNPNNPTGHRIDPNAILYAASCLTDTLFVIDQAYADYLTLPLISHKEAVAAGNVVLLSSLTKRFSIPGLRIGYATGSAGLLDRLRALRMPWSVNALAIEAARWLLRHRADYPIDAPALHAEALRISAALEGVGIKCCHTDCNFLLALLPDRTAAELKEWLVERHALLIRDASNFETLTPRHFRVAAQSPEQNEILINALKQWTELSQ
ncbi:MAG: aminotransferase class I/II-fold pyridoxal phosphate-dependent enzyme [Candidatus Amulumruptor sp.]|nr:aminotransferase class I/II-fold pyridoxal phosphate-dependent enzyme [Candidatus Amulumruptor sp.]